MAASHSVLTHWYLQLSQQLNAGIVLTDALELSEGPAISGRRQMADALRAGQTWAQVVQSAGAWLPTADRPLLIAAETTARLPQTCQRLSVRHQRLGATQRSLLLSLIYPLGIFHLAAFLVPFLQQLDFESGLSAIQPMILLTRGLCLLAPLWAGAALIALMIKTQSPILPAILGGIPLLRRYQKAQALADFSSSLGSFIEAGLRAPQAWRQAAWPAVPRPCNVPTSNYSRSLSKASTPRIR